MRGYFDSLWPEHAHVTVTNSLVKQTGMRVERDALRGSNKIHVASALRMRQRFPDRPWNFAVFDDKVRIAAEAEGFFLA